MFMCLAESLAILHTAVGAIATTTLAGARMLLLLVCMSTAMPGAADAPASPAASIDWSVYGGTEGGGHFSSAAQITPNNVANLVEAWRHNSGDKRTADPKNGVYSQSSFQATPIVIDEVLYYCSGFNQVFALDAASGEELWRFDPGVDRSADILPNCRGVSYWSSGQEGFCEQRIIQGTLDARLIALDAYTGAPCPDFGDEGTVDLTHGLSEHAAYEYSVTSPPAILGDLAITGSMVLDNVRLDVPSGVVRAYNIRDGELAWAWNPVPEDMEPLNEDGSYRSGTTNVWSIISVDSERNLVFVPTGNTSPDYFGGLRNGLDEFSSAVVALDGDSGELVWHYQMVHHDIWDYDTPAQPTLMDLRIDNKVIPALVQVTKMGMTFVLNRETGAPIWPVEERPVPQNPVAGEYLSPTQPFPTHIPHLVNLDPLTEEDMWGLTFLDKHACVKQLQGLRNEGIYTPPSTQGSIFMPGNGGGNNWGSPVIVPDKQLMLVVTMTFPNTLHLYPKEQCGQSGLTESGSPYCMSTERMASPLGVPCTAPPWGRLDAVDLVAGEVRWSKPLGTTRTVAPFPFWWIKGVPAIGGPISTAGGVTFVGASIDKRFRAFDTATGNMLWQVSLPASGNATPMTYQLASNKQQYVVIAAGGHWQGMEAPQDDLIAFRLSDEAP